MPTPSFSRRLPRALSLIAVLLAAPLTLSGQSVVQDPASQPQTPPVTFRAEVNYVEVDARVLDESGRFIGGLTAADFQVFEDGKPQKVDLFSVVNMPVTRTPRPLFASRPIESDVATNIEGLDGRIYVIVLDDFHTNPQRSPRVRAAARRFIEQFVGANDMVAIVHTSGRSDAGQDFTNNQRLLLAAVDKFMGRKLRSATLNRIDQEMMTRGMRQPGERVGDIDDMERGFQARSMLDGVRQLMRYLSGIGGRRKAIVLFSEGIDYDINNVFDNREATNILDSTRLMLSEATRANVAMYTVDPRGLGGMAEEGIEVQSFPEDQSLGINSQSMFNELQLGQNSLRVMAAETGGFAIVNTNDFTGAFQRIVDDNSAYYVLGYYPTNDKRDGKFRKIEVKVPSRPRAQVRARKGYIAARGRSDSKAPAGDLTPELRNAMNSPLPLSELPLAVTAAVFKGPQPNGSVVLSTLVAGPTLPLEERDGLLKNALEVAVSAVNQSGKVFSGGRNTLELNMRPDTATRARALGFRMVSTIDLPPGRYTVRIGAREQLTKKAGSVSYDLEVPDFTKKGLLISSLALTSVASSAAPTARSKDPLQQLLPGPLSTHRAFPQGDELALFTEVYDNSGAQPHKVDITVTLKAEGGQSVFETREERDYSELKGSGGGYGITARVPLAKTPPGLYVLAVEARSRLATDAPVRRETIVRVMPAAPAAP